MFLFAIIFYFILVSGILALVFLPSVRERALLTLSKLQARSQTLARRTVAAGKAGAGHAVSPLGEGMARLGHFLLDHWKWVGASALMLLTVPAIALLLRHWHAFEGYDHTAAHEVNPRIAALLEGEQLAPPPPLPPELFMTREVEQVYPLAQGASRQWELLDADFRQRLLVVFRIMREQHGYEMALIEGYRSPERQAQLAALGKQVTQAGAFQSYHQFGLAADCAFYKNGRLVISEQDPWAAKGYEYLGDAARSAGMVWGGNWQSIKDLGHVELQRPGILRKG